MKTLISGTSSPTCPALPLSGSLHLSLYTLRLLSSPLCLGLSYSWPAVLSHTVSIGKGIQAWSRDVLEEKEMCFSFPEPLFTRQHCTRRANRGFQTDTHIQTVYIKYTRNFGYMGSLWGYLIICSCTLQYSGNLSSSWHHHDFLYEGPH